MTWDLQKMTTVTVSHFFKISDSIFLATTMHSGIVLGYPNIIPSSFPIQNKHFEIVWWIFSGAWVLSLLSCLVINSMVYRLCYLTQSNPSHRRPYQACLDRYHQLLWCISTISQQTEVTLSSNDHRIPIGGHECHWFHHQSRESWVDHSGNLSRLVK